MSGATRSTTPAKTRRSSPVGSALAVVAAVALLVVLLPGVLDVVGPAFRSALANEGIELTWRPRAGDATAARWLLTAAAAAALAGLVARWWWRRRRRLRAEQVDLLVARLGRAMPADWRPKTGLRIRKWRGTVPTRLRVQLSPNCPAADPEWQMEVTTALRSALGPIAPIRWPQPGKRGRREIEVYARPPKPRGDIPSGRGAELDPAAVEERLVKTLSGLVPRPVPQVRRDAGGQLLIQVSYGETTRDQSMQWRARVVDQISARLGQSFRATWDRQQRVFTLTPVPELPASLDWREQVRRLRELNPGQYVAGYGTDEDGNIVAYEPGDREPHAMHTGKPGSGKAYDTSTPIPTPTGWTTMGDLKVGDEIFDEAGEPTTVTGVYDQPPDRDCYEVVFTDGSILVADAEHLWWTEDRAARRSQRIAEVNEPHRLRQPRLAPAATAALRVHAAAAGLEETVTIPEAARLAGVDQTRPLLRQVAKTVRALPEPRAERYTYVYPEQTVSQVQTVRLYPAPEVYSALADRARSGRRHPKLEPHAAALRQLAADCAPDAVVTARDLVDQFDVPYRRAAGWLERSGAPGQRARRPVQLHVTARTVQRAGNPIRVYPKAALLRALADAGDEIVFDQRHKLTGGRVRTTLEIRDTLTTDTGHLNHSIPVCKPLGLPAADLPIGPYTLGCLLGDGGTWQPCLTSADPEIVDRIRAEGYEVRLHALSVDSVRACRNYYVVGIHRQLRQLGLLKYRSCQPATKRIPPLYLRASEGQRRALLAGLLDTDGTVAPQGTTQFTTVIRGLAEDVLELALSLGYRAISTEGVARLYGWDCGPKWTIAFTTGDQVFWLRRKHDVLASRTANHNPQRTTRRYICEVRPVLSRPMRCISVDSPNRLFLAGRSMIPSHNTVAMISQLNSLLLAGCLVAILDPKKKDFAPYLGRPGVICVATTVEDMVGALIDFRAEVDRRAAAASARGIEDQYPHLRQEGPPPALSVIDQVPLIIFFDELSVFVDAVDAWWRTLSKDQRLEEWGTSSSSPPFLLLPGQIVALARAIKIHMVVGTQRADAKNFGDATTMRDNLAHMSSLGEQSAIGSEMQWGDRSTGRDVVITDDVGGTGVSNGLRISPEGRRLGRGLPVRYKAWFSGDADDPGCVARSEEFWAEVAAVAPDASLVRLPHVSDGARDPVAALRLLRAQAYGDPAAAGRDVPLFDPAEPAAAGPAGPVAGSDEDLIRQALARGAQPQQVAAVGEPPAAELGDLPSAPAGPEDGGDAAEVLLADDLLRRAAELVVTEGKGSAALLQRQLRIGSSRAQQLIDALEAAGVVGPSRNTKPREVLVDTSALQRRLHPGGDIPSETAVIPPVSPPAVPRSSSAPARNPAGEQEDDPEVADVDDTGRVWESVSVARVELGDLVVVGDLSAAEVVETPILVEDEFDGSELVRLVLLEDGAERVVDLADEEYVQRRQAA